MWVMGPGQQDAAKLLLFSDGDVQPAPGKSQTLTKDPLNGGGGESGRGSRQPEANHRKPHHGHVVGEGCLWRTKDPFLG